MNFFTTRRVDIRLLLCLFLLGANPTFCDVEEGNRLYQKGDYEKALKTYESALANAPDSAEICFDLGLTHLQLGQHREALQAFQQAEIRVPIRSRGITLEKIQLRIGNELMEVASAEKDPIRQLELLSQASQIFRRLAQTPKEGFAKEARLATERAMKKTFEIRKRAQELAVWKEPLRLKGPTFVEDLANQSAKDKKHQSKPEKGRPRSTGDTSVLDEMEAFASHWGALDAEDLAKKEFRAAQLKDLDQKVEDHLAELEKLAGKVANDSPQATRIDWIYLNLLRIRTKLLSALSERADAAGETQEASLTQGHANLIAGSLSGLLESKLFHQKEAGSYLARVYPRLTDLFSHSFSIEIRMTPTGHGVPKNLAELKKTAAWELNYLLGGEFTQPNDLSDIALGHALQVTRGDLSPAGRKKEQELHQKRNSLTLGTDEQVDLRWNEPSRLYGSRLAVDTVHALGELGHFLKDHETPENPEELSTGKQEELAKQIEEFVKDPEYEKSENALREGAHPIPKADFEAFEATHVPPPLSPEDAKKEALAAEEHAAEKPETTNEEKVAAALLNKPELIKLLRHELENADLESFPPHRRPLVKELLKEIASKLEHLHLFALQRMYESLVQEPITMEKIFKNLSAVKSDFKGLYESPFIKEDPLHTLVFLNHRFEDFSVSSIPDLERFNDVVLNPTFEEQEEAKKKDAWEEMRLVFGLNDIPTHTIGDFSKTKQLITTLIEAKKIDAQPITVQAENELRGVELEEDATKFAKDLSAGRNRRGLGSGLSDEDESGNAHVLAVYYPKNRRPFLATEMGFKLEPLSVSSDSKGVPADPAVTEIIDQTQTLWIRQGRSRTGRLKIPGGAVLARVVVNGVDKTSEVKRDPQGNFYVLEDAKHHETEITVYPHGRSSEKDALIADPAIRKYYLNPPPPTKSITLRSSRN